MVSKMLPISFSWRPVCQVSLRTNYSPIKVAENDAE
jgi:hypothetical protein